MYKLIRDQEIKFIRMPGHKNLGSKDCLAGELTFHFGYQK